jgi:hypothetical protein
MLVRSLSRAHRAFRRNIAVVLASLVLSALLLPASASAHTLTSINQVVRPADGVGDSPVID